MEEERSKTLNTETKKSGQVARVLAAWLPCDRRPRENNTHNKSSQSGSVNEVVVNRQYKTGSNHPFLNIEQ